MDISSLARRASGSRAICSLGFAAAISALAFLFLFSFLAKELLTVESVPLDSDFDELLGLLPLFFEAFACPPRLVLRPLEMSLFSLVGPLRPSDSFSGFLEGGGGCTGLCPTSPSNLRDWGSCLVLLCIPLLCFVCSTCR